MHNQRQNLACMIRCRPFYTKPARKLEIERSVFDNGVAIESNNQNTNTIIAQTCEEKHRVFNDLAKYRVSPFITILLVGTKRTSYCFKFTRRGYLNVLKSKSGRIRLLEVACDRFSDRWKCKWNSVYKNPSLWKIKRRLNHGSTC